jgi:transposase
VSLTAGQLSMLVEAIDWRNTAWTVRPEVVA